MNQRAIQSIDDLFHSELHVLLSTLRGRRWRLGPDAARDVLADTYVQCRRIEVRVLSADSPACFMMAVMGNCARRFLTRQGKLDHEFQPIPEEDSDSVELEALQVGDGALCPWPEATPEVARQWVEIQSHLQDGLEALRVENSLYADVVESHAWGDCTFEEIAVAFELKSSAAARGVWRRAAGRLLDWWRARVQDDDPRYLSVLVALPGGIGRPSSPPVVPPSSTDWWVFRSSSLKWLAGAATLVGTMAVFWQVGPDEFVTPTVQGRVAQDPVSSSIHAPGVSLAPVALAAVQFDPPRVAERVRPVESVRRQEGRMDQLVPSDSSHLVEPPEKAVVPAPSPARDLDDYRRVRELLEHAREESTLVPKAVAEYDRLLATDLSHGVKQLADLDRAELAVRSDDRDSRGRLLDYLQTNSDPGVRASALEMLAVALAKEGDCAELRGVPDGEGGTVSAPDELRRRCRRSARRML